MEEGEIVDEDSDYYDLPDEIKEPNKAAKETDSSLIVSTRIMNKWFQKECRRLAMQVEKTVEKQDMFPWYGGSNWLGKESGHGDQLQHVENVAVNSRFAHVDSMPPDDREELVIRNWMQRVAKTYEPLRLRDTASGLQNETSSINQRGSLAKRNCTKPIDEILNDSVDKLFDTIEKYWSECSSERLECFNEARPKNSMIEKWMTGTCEPPEPPTNNQVYRVCEEPWQIGWDEWQPSQRVLCQRQEVMTEEASRYTPFSSGMHDSRRDYMFSQLIPLSHTVSPNGVAAPTLTSITPTAHAWNPFAPGNEKYPKSTWGVWNGTSPLFSNQREGRFDHEVIVAALQNEPKDERNNLSRFYPAPNVQTTPTIFQAPLQSTSTSNRTRRNRKARCYNQMRKATRAARLATHCNSNVANRSPNVPTPNCHFMAQGINQNWNNENQWQRMRTSSPAPWNPMTSTQAYSNPQTMIQPTSCYVMHAPHPQMCYRNENYQWHNRLPTVPGTLAPHPLPVYQAWLP